MRGVITAPKKVITGAFSVLFAFQQEVELSADNIRVETLEGDALGHTKDRFSGRGKNYHLLCYIPDARTGKSRISVVKEGLSVRSVEIVYDTVRTIAPVWGVPFHRNGRTEIPLTFPTAVIKVRRRHFQVSRPLRFQLYGSGMAYQLVVEDVDDFSVTVAGTVQKENGLDAVIQETVVEVDSATLN